MIGAKGNRTQTVGVPAEHRHGIPAPQRPTIAVRANETVATTEGCCPFAAEMATPFTWETKLQYNYTYRQRETSTTKDISCSNAENNINRKERESLSPFQCVIKVVTGVSVEGSQSTAALSSEVAAISAEADAVHLFDVVAEAQPLLRCGGVPHFHSAVARSGGD